MELRSLSYFVGIADEGSITRAAEKLGVAQPALTRHVKQLEAELGVRLFTRLPRGVRLTRAGGGPACPPPPRAAARARARRAPVPPPAARRAPHRRGARPARARAQSGTGGRACP